MTSAPRPREAELATEAEVFARYLVDRPPPADLVERYRAAGRILFADPPDPRDAAMLRFVRRRPWSLPLLDAACGILQPQALLRRKILVLAAILETSPVFADDFLPCQRSPLALAASLAAIGLTAAARFALGLVIYPLAARCR